MDVPLSGGTLESHAEAAGLSGPSSLLSSRSGFALNPPNAVEEEIVGCGHPR